MNRIKRKGVLICSCIFMAAAIMHGQVMDQKLPNKVYQALQNIYPSNTIKLLTSAKGMVVNNNMQYESFYTVQVGANNQGYVYIGQAPSMKNVFDYMIVFDETWKIKKSKVLIYREQHGRQIGEARWLAQFDGMNTKSNPQVGTNIDGISGATISAKSMTNSIHKVLQSAGKTSMASK